MNSKDLEKSIGVKFWNAPFPQHLSMLFKKLATESTLTDVQGPSKAAPQMLVNMIIDTLKGTVPLITGIWIDQLFKLNHVRDTVD